jgi:hypothetical protein
MSLIGSREDWESFIRDNSQHLKDQHLEWIAHTIANASPDAQFIEIDAAMIALRQTVDRTERGAGLPVAEIAAQIADTDERWWLRRAQALGLASIRPVDPWPRRPDAAPRGTIS